MIALVTEAVPPLGLARYGALFRVPHVRRLVLSRTACATADGDDRPGAAAARARRRRELRGGGRRLGLLLRRDRRRVSDRRAPRRPARAGAHPAPARVRLPGSARRRVRALAGRCAARADRHLRRRRRGADAAGRLVAAHALRARCSRTPSSRAAAYAIEASLQEITFVVGPLLVALLTALVSPVLALAVAAAAGGDRHVARRLRRARPRLAAEEEREAGSILGALESRGVVTIVGLSACLGARLRRDRGRVPGLRRRATAAPSSAASRSRSSRAAASWVGSSPAHASRSRRCGCCASRRSCSRSGSRCRSSPGRSPSMSVLAFVAGLAIAPVVMSAYGLIDAVAHAAPPPRRSPGSRQPSSPASRSGCRSAGS